MSLGRRAALAGLGLAGLALYLWPAIVAPAVVWSDGRIDMEWARAGTLSPPANDTAHPAKAGYLLFLRTAMGAFPAAGAARSIVLVQSALLWFSIAATAIYVGRRRGARFGVALYALLLLFLRLRDSASAVMSEAIAAAFFLPLVAILLFPPSRRPALHLVSGAAAAVLFWIRPNVGMVAVVLALAAARPIRAAVFAAAGFAAVVLPVWFLTRPASGGDSLRGLAHPVYAASAEYYWLPSLGPWPQGSGGQQSAEELRRTGENWKALLRRSDADAGRELRWRCLYGFFGTEFYDARWSPVYRTLTAASRIAAPWLILAAVSLLLTRPFRDAERPWNLAAPLLLLLLLAQNLLLGSHPRYVLPFLPGFLLLALVGLADSRPLGRVGAAVLAVLLAVLLHGNRGALGWEWGRIESAGVVIRQRIPKGSLPAAEPATLHLRVATSAPPENAGLEVLGEDSRVLPSHRSSETSQVLSVSLPLRLLSENLRRPVEITVRSTGRYGPDHFQLFPLVPPPWSQPAHREGSREVSPSTGITAGAFDWWAHAGADQPR